MVGATDSQLMERYALGEGKAFDELFRRYEGRLYAYFLRRTRSPDAARELYQELFLRIHRFRARFDPSRGFESWFFTIASHVFVDHLRRSRGFEEPAENALWDRAQSREFNVGIEAAEKAPLFELRLEPSTLQAVASVSGRVVITVYAPERMLRSLPKKGK